MDEVGSQQLLRQSYATISKNPRSVEKAFSVSRLRETLFAADRLSRAELFSTEKSLI